MVACCPHNCCLHHLHHLHHQSPVRWWRGDLKSKCGEQTLGLVVLCRVSSWRAENFQIPKDSNSPFPGAAQNWILDTLGLHERTGRWAPQI